MTIAAWTIWEFSRPAGKTPDMPLPRRRITLIPALTSAGITFHVGLFLDASRALDAIRTALEMFLSAGLAGHGTGMARALMIQSGDPWNAPSLPPFPIVALMEMGLPGIVACLWFWWALFRELRRGDARRAEVKSSPRREARRLLALTLLSLCLLPAPHPFVAFALPLVTVAWGARPVETPPDVAPSAWPPGLLFRLAGIALVAFAVGTIGLNLARLALISVQAAAAARSAAGGWYAEHQGRHAEAISAWSDAAWRLTLIGRLSEIPDPAASEASQALRHTGMDRALAGTPGWFTHPRIRGKMPLEWPLPAAARDAAHFGQARSAWALGRAEETRVLLEALARANAETWPEAMIAGAALLRALGNEEYASGLERLADEAARHLPPLPSWAPPDAVPPGSWRMPPYPGAPATDTPRP